MSSDAWVKVNPMCWLCGNHRVFVDGIKYTAWTGDHYIGWRDSLKKAQNLALTGR